MINTHLLQDLSFNKPLGFSRNGGTMRFYMHKSTVSQSDWWDTIDYAIGRGWIVPTGAKDATGPIYNWVELKGAKR